MRLTFALFLLLLIAPFVSVNIWAQGSPTPNRVIDDEFPNDENETIDSDGDGVGDNA
jgi:hypothetical protein